MEKWKGKFRSYVFHFSTFLLLPLALGFAQGAKRFTPYSGVQPILDALRAELVPADLRDIPPTERSAAWPGWVGRHDAAVRARVAAGDDDSVVHLLLFGTTFTTRPPITEQDLAGLLVRKGGADVFVPSPLLSARITDFTGALASPDANERLAFARETLARHGLDPATETGRNQVRRWLEERASVVGAADRRATLLDPGSDPLDRLTLFRDRGLSSDTSIPIEYGIEQALDALKAGGVVREGAVTRAAVIGPGLDVVDKQNGFDFYPMQTMQPFALVDSLARLALADAKTLEVTAFDVSPRVLQHLERARERARGGAAYPLVLSQSRDRRWHPDLQGYWERAGNWIGEPAAKVPAVPANAGRVDVRGVSVRPDVVLAVTPVDLNIVTERLEGPAAEPFDLVVATNILLYYDVFEQSLALANIADMLRPGGILLTNNRVFELPGSPLTGIGYTDVVYMTVPGVGDAGDRIIWYQRQ